MKKNLFLILTVVLASAPVGAQPTPSTEQIDLMRQITTQWVRPNLLVVLDISGSMRWDMWGVDIGVDARGGQNGNADKPQWQLTSTTTGCSGGKKKYTYKLQFRYPSRMAMVKNALGNSVTIWAAPNEWRNSSFWPEISGWTKSFSQGVTNTVTYTSGCLSQQPSLPQQLQNIPIPDPLPPQDLVGTTADKINWGLAAYSGTYASCSKAELVAPIDTSDSGNVTTFENYMRLYSAGGLPATGGTPTRGGLEFAKDVIQKVKNGGTVTDYSNAFGGSSFTFPPDPKRTCGRSYSVLLVTDGQSNVCNANGSYCWKDPATNRCDGYSGYTCPNSLVNFPAQKSKELWQNLGVRTFVIGVSDQIGPCELNHVAFEGKTDASSPNGDAGFDYANDPRLASYSVNDNQLPSPSNLPYAYFVSNAVEFRNAVAQILAALGTGDYVTSAPSVSSMAGVAEGIGLLASVDYPQFKGHLLAYDVSAATGPFPLLWDAGQVLVTGMQAGNIPNPPLPNNGLSRSIYTWKPSTGALIKIEATASVVNELTTICGNCGITMQVIDFILGNNGSGTARAWKLGALINSSPAIVGRPVEWKQATGRATQRKEFEDTYQNRHPLVWVGGSDGMLHAFDLADGAEILAILPPTMLPKQVGLFQRYQQNPVKFPTGQPMLPQDHVYGVANSARFADIFIPGKGFRTVLFLTEGPGGTGIHALDITHPYPGRTGVVLRDGSTRNFDPDPDYQATEPFAVLWSYTKNGDYGTQALPALRETWGIPAVAMDANEDFYLVLPSGYRAAGQDPGGSALFLRAHNGQVVKNHPVLSVASSWVTNYLAADAAFWQTNAKRFQPDNYANQGVLGDLNGQLWVLDGPSWNLTRLASYTDSTGRAAPLYYATAVAAYPMRTNPDFSIYASISGNFYEKSPYINPPLSWLPNPNQYHQSALYLRAEPLSGGSTCTKTLVFSSLRRPNDPSTFLSRRTQPTAYPLLLIPTPDATNQNALVLATVYDPDALTCIGATYLVIQPFNPATCSLGTATVVFGGGGASSGFVIGPQAVLFAKSFVGQGGRAQFEVLPIQPPQEGSQGAGISWWRELQ